MSKLPMSSGLSGLARQYVTEPKKPVKASAKTPSAEERKALAEAALREAEIATAGPKMTKAERVKAWRLANPEAYAKQKAESAEKRRAKKDKKEST